MEIDRVAKSLSVPKATGRVLDPLNSRVDALGSGVGHAVVNRIHDAFEMVLDCLGGLFHRLQPRTNRPAVPLLQRSARPSVNIGFKLDRFTGLDWTLGYTDCLLVKLPKAS